MRALKVRSILVGQQPTESHYQSWSYNHTRSCQRTQRWPFYSCVAFDANWKGEKAQLVGASQADHKSKKSLFLSVICFYSATMNYFLIGLWHTTKSRLYTTTTDNQLCGWTEKKLQSTSQNQTRTKKRSWSLSGGLLQVWVITAFWVPAKPSHVRSMLNRSVRCTDNCNTCAGPGQQKGPHSSPWQHPPTRHTTSTSKVERRGLWSFASSAIFTWPLTNWLPLP